MKASAIAVILVGSLAAGGAGADERVPLPPAGPEVTEETAAFYDAADDLPDRAVERGGRLVVPFDLPANAREVKLPMNRQVWSGFERVKILVDADFEGEDAVESAIVRVTVRPGLHPQFSWPGFDLPARAVGREGDRLVIEVSAAEIGERAPETGVVFPCNLDEIRLVRRAGAPAAKGYLATVDLRKEGFREEFSCDNGRLLIADLDDPAKCRPHFTLFNDGPACEGSFAYRVFDQPTGRTLAEGRVERTFGEGESADVELPKPERAGCYHIDYTLEREGGYRYSHTVSYAAMHPAGKNPELFSDDFKFSCVAHLEFYSLNERRRMMAYMREMGANYTRAGGHYWNDFQPDGPDQPFVGWKRYVKGTDICLSNGVERGVSILIAPKWAKDPDVDVKLLEHFPRYECLEEYVAKFAGGLGGRVRHFEGNNEPNLTDWTAELEGRYERMLYAALKKARPDAIYLSGEWGGFSKNWDDAFYVTYNPSDYDVWAQHYHNSFAESKAIIDHLEQLRHDQGITKPWWGDECANDYTNQHQQAAEMFRKNVYSRGHGAIGMTWYNLRCKGSQKPLPQGELSYGMLTWDLCPRGVYVAFNAYAKTFRGSVLRGEGSLFADVMSWRYERMDEGTALYPLWSMNRRYRTMTLDLPTDAESVEEIDLYGNVRALPVAQGRVRIELASDPVTLRLRPMSARLNAAELVAASEIPDYNRAVATPERGACFRADSSDQYVKLVESSGENDDLVWRNTEDLSGYLYVFWPEGDELHVRICVDDDIHHPAEKGGDLVSGDGFRLMLRLPGREDVLGVDGAWHDDLSTGCRVWSAADNVDRETARDEIRIGAWRNEAVPLKTIWYEVFVPLRLLGTDAAALCKSGLRVNAVLNDNDGRCREGCLTFAAGDPSDPENLLTVDFMTEEERACLYSRDTFEPYAPGTVLGSGTGWIGENQVVERTYRPALPPGYPMPQAEHTRVLRTKKVLRSLPTGMGEDGRMDLMFRFRRPSGELMPPAGDVRFELSADPHGRLCVWHSALEGGAWRNVWTPLTEGVYANGAWLRIGLETRASRDGGFVRVRVDGSYRPSARGFRDPDAPEPYGAWYRLAEGVSGERALSTVGFSDTEIDDVVFGRRAAVPAESGPSETNGIAYAWFDDAGLPRDPSAPAPFLPDYSLGDVHDAGIDPYSSVPFSVTGLGFGPLGRMWLEFNGYRGDLPGCFTILRSDTPDFRACTALGPEDGAFRGDAARGTTVWEENVPSKGDGPAFFKVKSVR